MPKYSKGLLIFQIMFLVTIGQLAIDIYLPSLPNMGADLNASDGMLQLTLSLFLLGYAGSQLLYGPISDAIGRRKPLLLGLAIYTLGSILSLFATSIGWLLVFRLLQGIGAGAPNSLSRAFMRDVFSGKELMRITALMALAWSVVPIVAPMFGGYIEHAFGWRGNFALLTLFGFMAFAVVYWLLPETRQGEKRTPKLCAALKSYQQILTNRLLLSTLLVLVLVNAMFMAYNAASPFLLQTQIGLTPVAYGWMMVISALGYVLGNSLNTQLVHHFESKQLVGAGLVLMTASTSIMLAFGLMGIMTTWVIVIPMFFTLTATALVYPNAISAILQNSGQFAGAASALVGAMGFLGGMVGTSIVAKLPETSQIPTASLLLILTLLSALCSLTIACKPMTNEGMHADRL